jgi:hypothetical protein
VVRISSIIPHPNADRLDIATIEGMAYQVVTAKGNFKPGDLAFYFPIDSVICDASNVTMLQLGGTRAEKILKMLSCLPIKKLNRKWNKIDPTKLYKNHSM